MKLHFDADQDFQKRAVQSVVDLFEGQPLGKGEFELSLGSQHGLGLALSGVRNELVLTEEQLLKNLREVQKAGGLPLSAALDGLHFSVEMETGTGKTYVYLRTVYELNRKYGFKKFVIVVPSIAIKEGALKNLEITREHFQDLYGRPPSQHSVYAADNISALRSFAGANTIQVLVMNIDSFAKDENVINKPNDKLSGRRPIEFIRAARPVVIVDEPQNMETEVRKKAVANLSPVFTLRYSATHKNLYNLVHKLDPVQAYDLGLVKQIEVDSVFAANDRNRAFIQIEDFRSGARSLSVKLKIDVNCARTAERRTVTARTGDDLYELSNKRETYRDGYIVNRLDAAAGLVEFSNGDVLYKGQTHGGLNDQIMKCQMEKAVEEHFRKELQLKARGIKVLTLFFIDRVENYRRYTEQGAAPGKFSLWFDEIYTRLAARPAYAGLGAPPAGKAHNGYFAQDKKGVLKDSSEGRETRADDEAYHLIMRDKERLLDLNEPLRFIFSHSALREGWDNPNVFQICTLNETRSEMKKRQEIGRGLRLCVDQNGVRVRDKSVNRLTVIANESYEEFARRLQSEIEDDCGVKFEGRVKNRADRVKVRYKKGFELDPRFAALWDRIKQRTTYRVEYKTAELIANAARKIKVMAEVPKPVIKAVRAELRMGAEGVGATMVGDTVAASGTMPKADVPDAVGYIQNRTELTRGTVLEILKRSSRIPDLLVNPQVFLDQAVAEIRAELHDLMIDGIKYERIAGKEYAMMRFSDKEVETYRDNLYKITEQSKTIADHIVIDGMSSVEEQFAKDCEKNENIEFFIKLPDWFTIRTPIGEYNPDWALIYKNENRVYFVVETKATLDRTALRGPEYMKIKCGEAHFREFSEVKYKPVKQLSELV